MTSSKGSWCRWASCPQQGHIFSPNELSLHVDECHVDPCSRDDLFICQWEGCKVYNRPSYSFGWLQRHVKQKHTKERPNRCLMNGCNVSFNSVEALQKHMHRHFEVAPSFSKKKPGKEAPTKTSSAAIAATKVLATKDGVGEVGTSMVHSTDVAEAQVVQHTQTRVVDVLPSLPSHKQDPLKVKIPRRSLFPSSPYAKPVALNGAHVHCDVIDRQTMSKIRGMVSNLTRNQARNQALCSESSPSITLTAQVIGERQCDGGVERQMLVRWTPRLIPDEWMCLSQLLHERVVTFSKLPCSQLSLLSSKCFGYNKVLTRRNKRKP